MQRGGKRRPIPDDEEEDDVKKNDNAGAIQQIDQGDEQKEKEYKEIVIRAQPNQ